MTKKHQKQEGLDARWERLRGGIPKVVKFSILFSFYIIVAGFLILDYGPEPGRAKFIGYLLGGALLYWQILNSSRRATAAEKAVELTERGHIHERFKSAIEHLENESEPTRLGSIYALHNIARDMDEYRQPIFEILCAHIRKTTIHECYKPRIVVNERKRPAIEVQSILNLLFKIRQNEGIYVNLHANLEHANLEGAELMDATLRNANLLGANLMGAVLSRADLYRAKIREAKCHNIWLTHTNLRECIFRSSELQRAHLSSSKNLKISQLLLAKTLYRASLPEGMKEEIQSENPKLLEKPDDKQKPDSEDSD